MAQDNADGEPSLDGGVQDFTVLSSLFPHFLFCTDEYNPILPVPRSLFSLSNKSISLV